MNSERHSRIHAFSLLALGGCSLRFCSFILLVVSFCARLNAQDPATVGQWSPVVSTGYEPVHLAVLPDGRLLLWPPHGGTAALLPQIWDPATGSVTPTPPPGYQIFCGGHSFLGNNQLLVTGGNQGNFVGVASASLYDFGTNTWTRIPDMNAGRWYPTNTTLANGDALVISGSINNSSDVNTLPQVWQVATQAWRDLTSAQLALPLYPRMFLAPNGKVFYATAQSPSRYLDTSGTGSWTPVANLNFNYRDYDTAVLYDTGKVFVAGGGDPPTATVEVIDLNAASPSWRYVASMVTARRQLNGTLLADGKVLITGGSSGPGLDNASFPVYSTEMWDPATEQFTPMASITKYRGYHSTAVLLPDGRVVSAGGDVSGATAEIFSPPYLFHGARPAISSSPSRISYGQTFSLVTPDAASISQVNLIRLSSVTHAFNQDQRINRLSFTAAVGSLNVTGPANPNLAPPGPYMVFILNGSGVPSVAKIVQLTSGLPPNAVAKATPSSGPVPLSVNFSSSGSADPNPNGTIASYFWDFGDGQTSAQANPSHTYTSSGTYTVKLTVTNNVGLTGSATLFITATVVNPPPPQVTSVNPAGGTQGATLYVVISGSNFQSGAACGFGSGTRVNSCIFNSTAQLTANVTIDSAAPLGSHSITVVNPDMQSATLANGFSVNPTAILRVQTATFSLQPSPSGTVTLTLPQATGAGHTLIVGMSFWPLDISSVTDGSGDTFTRGLATSIFHNVSGSGFYDNFYYAKSTAGGTTSLTLNFSGGSTYLLVAVGEVAGLDPAAPLDQSGYHESLTATTAWSSAAVTTTAANEYLFSWAATEASRVTCSSPASGWVIESQTNPATVCLLDRVVSATGSYQASVTASTAGNYAMEIATFKGNTPSGPPPAPIGLTATAGNAQVSLAWNASSGAASYNLYRSVNGGAYSQLNTSPITTTSYTDSSLTNGTPYCYEAAAVNSSGESAKSGPACATPQPPPPPPAISLIQKATFSRQPTSGGTVTLTLPQATAAGHTLIVGMSFWPLDISSVTDGSGDAFTRGLTTSIYHNVSGSATYTNFYYAKSTAGGTTSLTLNFSGGSTYLLVAVAEVAGLDPSVPLDQSGYHESLTATAAWSSAAVTTTAANEYLFSWAATEASRVTCSSPASGWVIESQTNPATVCLLDRIVSATGSYQASVTPSSAQNYAMEIATFKSQ